FVMYSSLTSLSLETGRRGSRVRCGRQVRGLADVVEFALECEAVESLQGKAEEETDSAIEDQEGVPEGAFDLRLAPANGGRVGHAPVGGHRLTGPYGADLFGGVVTDGQDEVELGSSGLGEFIPGFAAEIAAGDVCDFELSQSFGAILARGMTSGAIGREIR